MFNSARLVFVLGLSFSPHSRAEEIGLERIYSRSELTAIDRENEMWRALRVDDDLDQSLQRLRDLGFSNAEVARFWPQVEGIWKVELERNFGWLSEEAIKKVETVDRSFIPRLRAIRLYETIGIRAPGQKEEKMTELTRD